MSWENLTEEEKRVRDDLRETRLEMRLRLPFQVAVFELLKIDSGDFERIGPLSQTLSLMIDDPNNIEIRTLIINKEFQKAAELAVEILKEKENLPLAA